MEESAYFSEVSRKVQHMEFDPKTGGFSNSTDPNKIAVNFEDAILISQHMLLREWKHHHIMVFQGEMERRCAELKERYEKDWTEAVQQHQQVKIELEAANIKCTQATQQLTDLQIEMNVIKEEKEHLNNKVMELQKRQEELIQDVVQRDEINVTIAKECRNLESQLQICKLNLQASKTESEAKDKDIARLKQVSPGGIAQEKIDFANQRLTTVLTAFRNSGQLLWEPKKVSETLDLVQGNITVAMMKYAVNINELSLASVEELHHNATENTHDFVTFFALANLINIPLAASSGKGLHLSL